LDFLLYSSVGGGNAMEIPMASHIRKMNTRSITRDIHKQPYIFSLFISASLSSFWFKPVAYSS